MALDVSIHHYSDDSLGLLMPIQQFAARSRNGMKLPCPAGNFQCPVCRSATVAWPTFRMADICSPGLSRNGWPVQQSLPLSINTPPSGPLRFRLSLATRSRGKRQSDDIAGIAVPADPGSRGFPDCAAPQQADSSKSLPF